MTATDQTPDLAAALAELTDHDLAELQTDVEMAANVDSFWINQRLGPIGLEWPDPPAELTEALVGHYEPLLDAIDADQARRAELRLCCLDCGVRTDQIGQYPYHCPDDLWHAVVDGGEGMLCLPCLGKRLDSAGLAWPWPDPVGRMAAVCAQIMAGEYHPEEDK